MTSLDRSLKINKDTWLVHNRNSIDFVSFVAQFHFVAFRFSEMANNEPNEWLKWGKTAEKSNVKWSEVVHKKNNDINKQNRTE